MADFDDSKTSTQTASQPPSFHGLEADLALIIESHSNSQRKPYPSGVPRDTADAVKWFIRLFAGQKHGEAVREVSTRNGKRFWVWPYAERIKNLTKSFFMADQDLRELVIAARQDRIEWRGDCLEHFVRIIDETERMRAMGAEKYRADIRPQIRAAILSMRKAKQSDDRTFEEKRQQAIEYTGVEV